MSYVFTKKQKKHYVFIFASFLILLILLVFFFNNRNIFVKKEYYNVIIMQSSSKGIKPHSEIIMNGFVIGHVSSVRLQENNFVHAKIYVYKDYAKYMRSDTKVFPISLLTKTQLIVEPYPKSSKPILPENSTLYASSILKVDYSEAYNIDVESSIDALALHIDLLVKTLLNPDFGIDSISHEVENMQKLIKKENITNWSNFLNVNTVTNVLNTGKITSLTLTNINKTLKEIEAFRDMYKRKRGSINNAQVNFDFAITNITSMAKDISANATQLKNLVNKLEQISNSMSLKRSKVR